MRPLRSLCGSIAVFNVGVVVTGSVVLGGPLVVERYLIGSIHSGWWTSLGLAIALIGLAVFAVVTGAFAVGLMAAVTSVDGSDPRTFDALGLGGIVGAVGALGLLGVWTGGLAQPPEQLAPVGESGTALWSVVLAMASTGLNATLWRGEHASVPAHRASALSAAEIRQARVRIDESATPTQPWAASRTSADQQSTDGSPDNTDAPTAVSSEYEFPWQTETDRTFDDVGGMDDIKARLERDVIAPLTSDGDVVDTFDIPVPNILLHGPPGTGKSFLATALAGEVDLPFVSLSGQDVTSKYINESATTVRTLFDEARALAEAHGGAVLFIDEIDAVLATRDAGNAHAEDSKVVTEFLTQLHTTGERADIVVIGATNRLDALDRAAIRNGRFDAKLRIGPPDDATRVAILQAQLADRPATVTEAELDAIASETAGLVAADLASLVIDAARLATYDRGGAAITGADLQVALEDYIEDDAPDSTASNGCH